MKANTFTSQDFRSVLGHVPTGVVAITSIDKNGDPLGMAVGSFTSVSLEPPLVGFFSALSSSTWPKISETGRFSVNILAADQTSVCQSLARQGASKFHEIEWTRSASGLPRITGCIAWIECDVVHAKEVGDHLSVIGAVSQLDIADAGNPLIFYRSTYGSFHDAPLQQVAQVS